MRLIIINKHLGNYVKIQLMKFYILLAIFILISCGQKDESDDNLIISPPANDDVVTETLLDPFMLHFGQTSQPNASGNEWANAITVDSDNNIYLAGVTSSNLVGTADGDDIFVKKINSDGTVGWSYQMTNDLGFDNSGAERIRDMEFYDGALYLVGYTDGDLIETNGGGGHDDIVVLKMSLEGEVIWSKQFGATSQINSSAGDDECWSLDVYNSSIYLGCMTSHHFLTNNATSGAWDILILKLATSDGSVEDSFQFGQAAESAFSKINDIKGGEVVLDIIAEADGVLITGYTSSDMTTTNSGSNDIYFLKYDMDNDELDFLTHVHDGLLSGAANAEGDDYILSVAGDSQYYYFTGKTSGTLGSASQGGDDCFVMKVQKSDASINSISQFTFNSSANDNDCRGELNSAGELIVIGTTYGSTSYGTLDGYSDAFVAKVDTTNLSPIAGIQYGSNITGIDSSSSWGEYSWKLAIDEQDNIIFPGGTYGSLLETANSLDTTSDLYLVRLNDEDLE